LRLALALDARFVAQPSRSHLSRRREQMGVVSFRAPKTWLVNRKVHCVLVTLGERLRK
jgi:hypothetical protein